MKAEGMKELNVRLSTAMIYLDTNWEGLAKHLGVTRQTITAVKSGTKNLGQETLRKLNEIEKSLGIASKETITESVLEASVKATSSDCLRCKEKDSEILHLRQLLQTADANLAKAQDNLTAMIELMQQKNDVTLASSALDGYGANKANKKGA